MAMTNAQQNLGLEDGNAHIWRRTVMSKDLQMGLIAFKRNEVRKSGTILSLTELFYMYTNCTRSLEESAVSSASSEPHAPLVTPTSNRDGETCSVQTT
ncbi:hypothetical protein KIN20_017666 [Parelaphostrongylus tenuis]|uniref:Uncharacterized protein n=1 Tax=Parelaphostrongylus tenuis TaxID=148309 RepID=A0AAD5QRM2_PARTN|nr:hypothetical protein KIN20_017666 [Parelaphostrongylus tenuis]